MSTEVAAQTPQVKMLTALIDAAAVSNPDLKTRVTVAAVWQYMRLPDSSFGWVPRTEPGSPPPPLPEQCKALCIITTLALGLTPGLGHILWLGNKCFIDIYGKRVLANRNNGLTVLSRGLRPFSTEERAMFFLGEHDRAVVLTVEFRRAGSAEVLHGSGYGIIDSTEFTTGKKPGLQTRKDAAMTLITRAERDFYNRYFPVDGIADMPENPREYSDQLEPEARQIHDPAKTVDLLAQPTAPLKTAVDLETEDRFRVTARDRFHGLCADVEDLKGEVGAILGADLRVISRDGTADELNDAGDVLESWLDSHASPHPPPQPAEKRGRGRPKGSTVKPAEAGASADPRRAAPVAAAPLTAPVFQEQTIVGTIDPDPPRAEDFDPGDAYEPPAQAPAPPSVTPPYDVPAAARAADFTRRQEMDRLRAVDRVHAALGKVVSAGGVPVKILGFNALPRVEDPKAGAPELESIAELLEKWAPDRPSSVERATEARSPPPPASPEPPPSLREPPSDLAPPIGRPAKPSPAASPPEVTTTTTVASTTAGKGQAYDMINKALGMPADLLPGPVRERLLVLKGLFLLPGDQLRLPKAIREAKDGKFGEIDGLIAARRQPVAK